MQVRKQPTILLLILLNLMAHWLLARDRSTLFSGDPDSYMQLGWNLVNHGTFGFVRSGMMEPSAYRPPLYSLMLAGILAGTLRFGGGALTIYALAALHLTINLATIVLTWRLAVRRGLGRWAVLAGALIAIDPLLLQKTWEPMTETLAALLLVASIGSLATSDRNPASPMCWLAGLVIGLAMLCRTVFWAFALLAVLASVRAAGGERRRRLAWGSLVLTLAAAVQLPWVIRNWVHFGQPVFTTTHGGYTLLLGNNDAFYDEIIRGSWRAWRGERVTQWQFQALQRAAQTGAGTEPELDRAYYRMAMDTINRRPLDFVLSVLYRVTALWRPFPHATESYTWQIRLGCAVFYVPELLAAAVALGCRRTWQWPTMLLPAALISFTLVHAIYWSDMRMRAPIMPALAILAAMGAERVWSRLRPVARGTHPSQPPDARAGSADTPA
jgi:hypothetical protein